MTLRDGELHVFAGAGVGLLSAGFVVMTLAYSSCSDADADSKAMHNPLEDMETIEASIAYRKAPKKQPEKKTRAPEEAKTKNITSDEVKQPPDRKKDESKRDDKPKKPPPDRSKFDEDENAPVNEDQKPDVGEFNDSVRGFAEVTAGEPFFRELAADFHEIWQWPDIIKTQATAAACLHINADGTIEKTKVDPKSGEPQLDESLAAGLKQLETKRKNNPTPVPTYLIKQATTRWICFRAKTPQQ
jgi:hypothetical protein